MSEQKMTAKEFRRLTDEEISKMEKLWYANERNAYLPSHWMDLALIGEVKARRAAERVPVQPSPPSNGKCSQCGGSVNKCGHSKLCVYSTNLNDGSGMSQSTCWECKRLAEAGSIPQPQPEDCKFPSCITRKEGSSGVPLQATAELEDLGTLIDRLDNLAHALKIPLKDSMHVGTLRESLPELVKDFKAAYAHEMEENPWEGQPK